MTGIKQIDMNCIEDIVNDSEVMKSSENRRTFEYNLNDKAAKGKLLKGAKRDSLEVVKNQTSTNLVFNVGAWNHLVLPSIKYWNQFTQLILVNGHGFEKLVEQFLVPYFESKIPLYEEDIMNYNSLVLDTLCKKVKRSEVQTFLVHNVILLQKQMQLWKNTRKENMPLALWLLQQHLLPLHWHFQEKQLHLPEITH
jgi:hypothetical protein